MEGPLDGLADPLPIEPIAEPGLVDAVMHPPGSKSLTNRALLLAALCDGPSRIERPLLGADDTERMIAALETLGARIEFDGPRDAEADLIVHGVGGRFRIGADGVTLNLNNAGTATRFLAAAALLADGPVTIDGNERMRQRPIGELGEALAAMGAQVSYPVAEGFPPIRIEPPGPGLCGSEVRFGQTKSSQYLSALLLVSPWLARGLTMRLDAPATSASYLTMTLELLCRLGVTTRVSADMRVIRVAPGPPPHFSLPIEPDASGATYAWTAGAILPGARVGVVGLTDGSMQGDAQYPLVLRRMGAEVERSGGGLYCRGPETLRGIMADMADMPDAAVSLAVACAFASGPSVLRGVRTLRDKECDRIAALQTELGKVGVRIDADVAGDPDAMTITPPEGGIDCSAGVAPVVFDTYRDHRMAMALALVGLRRPGVSIADPVCVDKTFPTYWREFSGLYPVG
ncbi:MAG: 3-phosphoshikimate 1-carboxyvinyltransferase [Phycisphaerales bacterium]|nr:MAG: 3-phosphoshikimate 1-carboxyvinyltransferase [Phycisphaerales bacterium]